MIRPFIITCDKRMDTFRKFVASYNQHARGYLKKPIVYYDGTGEEYLDLIDSMDPELKIRQKTYPSEDFGAYSETVDYKAICIFPKLVQDNELFDKDRILFLEDDILFSSRFGKAIEEVEKQFDSYHVVDIVTLYGSGNCYWPEIHNKAKHPIYRFSGSDYYGNLAVIFDTNVLEWWRDNIDKVWLNQYSGWDIKIGNIFEQKGFNFYCTNKHFVQHQIGYSVIAKNYKHQQSSNFVR